MLENLKNIRDLCAIFLFFVSEMASPKTNSTTNNVAETDDSSLRSLSSDDVSQAPRGYCCAKSINPADGRGRKLHLLQMLVLPFIPILALIVQTSVLLHNIMTYRNEVMEIDSQVRQVIFCWEVFGFYS